MICKCCRQRLSSQRDGLLAEYCDVVCYAAGKTLTPSALELWREGASLLWMPSSLARWAGRGEP